MSWECVCYQGRLEAILVGYASNVSTSLRHPFDMQLNSMLNLHETYTNLTKAYLLLLIQVDFFYSRTAPLIDLLNLRLHVHDTCIPTRDAVYVWCANNNNYCDKHYLNVIRLYRNNDST